MLRKVAALAGTGSGRRYVVRHSPELILSVICVDNIVLHHICYLTYNDICRYINASTSKDVEQTQIRTQSSNAHKTHQAGVTLIIYALK